MRVRAHLSISYDSAGGPMVPVSRASRACVSGSRPHRLATARRGAATVEFAIVAPLLFLLFFGIVEFGRAFWVAEMLQTAARSGCRTATVVGQTNATVQQVVTKNLATIRKSTTSISVNGVVKDVSTARKGDIVTVRVVTNYADVSLLPAPKYLLNLALSGSVSMRKE